MINCKEVLPINKQLVILDLAGVLRSEKGQKLSRKKLTGRRLPNTVTLKFGVNLGTVNT